MIGPTAEYQHQINSGVLINTFIHCGYRAQADSLSTEGNGNNTQLPLLLSAEDLWKAVRIIGVQEMLQYQRRG